MIIAIDGTLASGKGTIARRIAAQLGLPYLDTGLLYRALGCLAARRDAAFDDEDTLASWAADLNPDQFDGYELRTAKAGQNASKVAALPKVRTALLDYQRRFAHQPGGAVLDGRDIGTVVCPEADIKLWIDADIAERARRRRTELAGAGEVMTQAQMEADLRERDARDRNRATAPMRKADDAVLIDTTDLSIDAAVDKARAVIEAVLAGNDRHL